ncbi:transcriptional regulator, TetR family [Micromonospora pattaloongensis]|uniref:Transcriptional regulator, TetR family n=1 Tax=Micromonospora pattaloongensis TaxID=405436 RepID=A0A1H3LUE0_9ACTN|nr:TetR/AcrR family transcriptional regulator C-terminal domain-containing protein [Micromonospora pattaloongensis]SDY68011.1 transcriptional regulator, TetR family [Micromonospora pattaloongensis]
MARIIDAAVELIDAEGTEALQMRRLAARLGVAQSALYKHVPSKDALLDALLERVLGDFDTNVDPELPWREQLTALAHRFRAALHAHSGLAGLLKTRDPLGPNSTRTLDAWARALLRAGLRGADAGHAWFTLVHYVIGFEATAAFDGRNVRRAFDPAALAEVHARFDALDPARYPGATALGRHIWNPAVEERFAYGLELLLDGLAARIAAAGR